MKSSILPHPIPQQKPTFLANDEALVFVHIPKTAGTTVSRLLSTWFAPQEIYHIRSPQHEGAPYFSPHAGSADDFSQLPESKRAQFRCLLGHVRFGIHHSLPRRARYFTLLRDPLQRYLSQIAQYNRMAAAGELGPNAVPVDSREFRLIKPHQFSNAQARWLAGLTAEAAASSSPDRLLAQAERHLSEHFLAVGVVEQIDRSLCTLSALVGRPRPNIGMENASAQRPSSSEWSDAERNDFAQANQIDDQLWRIAVERLAGNAAWVEGVTSARRNAAARLFTPLGRVLRKLGAE